MSAALTILGSGTCAATARRSMAGYHLQAGEREILLDIGAGSLRRLLEAGKDYGRIEAILITHLHIDHIGDFVPFLWATRYTPEFAREAALDVFGPPGMRDWYARLAAAHGDWLRDLPFPLRLTEVENEAWTWNIFTIRTLPMQHGVPANGYRLAVEEKTIVYTGDTGSCPNVAELSRDADLLLIECSFPDDGMEVDTHLTPGRVGRIAAAARVRRVVMTHFYPECDRADVRAGCGAYFSGEIVLAEDLACIYL